MRQSFLRILMLGGVVGYLVVLSLNSVGQWLLDHPTAENIRQGIQWNSGNPSLWTAHARHQLEPFENPAAQPAAQAYLKAAALNPLDPVVWDGLATAYLQMGEREKAEAALRTALVAVPRSPYAAWRLANFLVQEGRTQESFPYLRIAATHEWSLRVPTFDLGWKLLDDPERIFQEIVPTEPRAREVYLDFLLRTDRLTEAYLVWSAIRSRSPSVIQRGNRYVERLATAGRGEEAARVWTELLKDTGRSATKPTGELLTNGNFEDRLVNDGLDWRFRNGPGFQVSVDDFVFQQGTRSFRVIFDGSANPDFAGVQQWVPVEPNRGYRFRGYLKTENINTDSGLRFSISTVAAPPKEQFVQATENRLGSSPWMLEQVEFQTGPNTRMVMVSLRRPPSRKLNNLIQGKVWIDNLSLTPLSK